MRFRRPNVSVLRVAKDRRVIALALAPLVVVVATKYLGGVFPGLPFLSVFAVLAAAQFFGAIAAVAEGLYCALLVGPLIGRLAVVPSQPSGVHLVGPLLFFLLLGVASGTATQQLRRRVDDERMQRKALTSLHARTLITFAGIVAQRDQPTAYHCERVAQNARALGHLYGLTGNELNALYWAGMLHDLGKIATPARILLKEGKLTNEEYEIIKRHPDVGADLLLEISPRFHQIAQGVRSHHERWNGSGYPAGLAGKDIPLFGRLLAVVDVFEAMTAPRPYRGPIPPYDVMMHLHERAGTEFDPGIVRLFASLYRRHLLRTYADTKPTPTDLGTGIFNSGFWQAQDTNVGAETEAIPEPHSKLLDNELFEDESSGHQRVVN